MVFIIFIVLGIILTQDYLNKPNKIGTMKAQNTSKSPKAIYIYIYIYIYIASSH
jgi:hypothetical protein